LMRSCAQRRRGHCSPKIETRLSCSRVDPAKALDEHLTTAYPAASSGVPDCY
jgi:hypothetical protein